MPSVKRTLAAIAAIGALGGCGGEDQDPERNPAEVREAMEATLTPDGPWDISGNRWLRISEGERSELAAQFIETEPERCDGAEPGEVAAYVTAVYAIDYPVETLAGVILPEGCDADLQS